MNGVLHLIFNLVTFSGPPIASQRNVFTVGRMGEEIKLICPVEGNPAPMIEWFKGDEKIDFQFTRYKPNRRNLKIRDASVSDSGRFYCRGINGYGKEQITIDLIVIDPLEFPDLPEGELPDISPPSFSTDTLKARVEYDKKVGDTITVSCTVSGKPYPEVSWYKNGVQMFNNIEFSGETSLLRIRNLKVEDSGTYTCVGRNMAGDLSKDYRVSVRNTMLDNPIIFNTPTNQTVKQGESASLDCRVQSAIHPTVKWLKKLDPRERYSDIEIITVGEESYRIIESLGINPSMSDIKKEVYVSQLELVNVKPSDAGMYICFVTNIMGGFNFKPAYLTVLASNESMFESPLGLSVSIGLAGITLIIILCLLFCLIRKKNKKPDQEVGEVRSTLLIPAAPPSIQDTVYSKTGQPLPPPPTPVQWSMVYGQNVQTSYTDSSQYGGNTYEVPRYGDYVQNPRISPVGGFVYGGYRKQQSDIY